jgi:hypothetical protein
MNALLYLGVPMMAKFSPELNMVRSDAYIAGFQPVAREIDVSEQTSRLIQQQLARVRLANQGLL